MFGAKGSGLALIAGGALTFLANALTPLLPAGAAFAATAASPIFAWRQGLSAVAALALLVGVTGLYRAAERRAARLEILGCRLAFLGSAALFAHEWGQVAIVHPLARQAPDSLAALEAAPGASAFDVAALIALMIFTVGWLSLGAAILSARSYPRGGPLALIVGFFAIPLLSAAVGPRWGTVGGAAIVMAGWVMLGTALYRRGERPTTADVNATAHAA